MAGRKVDHEEVGQQVFIALFKALPRFRFDASLKTYITRIAINKTLSELKRVKRSRGKIAEGYLIERYPAKSSSSSEAQELANLFLMKLPPKYRTAVMLRYIQELSNQEAAEVLKRFEPILPGEWRCCVA